MVNQQFAFAIHTMSVLATHQDEPVTSDYLASSINTNPVVVRRLLSKLSKNGLIETQLGKKGGVRLGKPAKQITLKDIFEAVQSNSLISTNKNKENKKCPISCKMKDVVGDIVDKAEKVTLNYFNSVTLADIVSKI